MWCSTHWLVKSRLLIGILSLGLFGSTWANTPEVARSDGRGSEQVEATNTRTHPQLAGSRLQGEATLRFWGWSIYQARLWTLPDFRPDRMSEQPLVLELEYLRDFAGKSIAERSLQEMRRAGDIPAANAQRWLNDMQRVFPDVRKGDRLTGALLPGQGARFWHNDRAVGSVDDPEFARRFFGIWLAPTTSEPDLRMALLGLAAPQNR